MDRDEDLTEKELLAEAAQIRAMGGRLDERTAAALVIENRKMRQTNWFYRIALSLLLISNLVGQFRSFFVTGPKITSTDTTVTKLDEALRGIGGLQAYVDSVQSRSNPAATAEIYRAIVETHNLLCAEAAPPCPPVVLPPPVTTTTTTSQG